MTNTKSIIVILTFIILPLFSYPAGQKYHFQLNWSGIQRISINEAEYLSRLNFDGAGFEISSPSTPIFSKKIRIDGNFSDVEVRIENPVYQILSSDEMLVLDNLAGFSPEIIIESSVSTSSGQKFAIVNFLPFRLNSKSGKYEKLLQFDLEFDLKEGLKAGFVNGEFAGNSVLATGKWYRISVDKTGIYKLTYEDMAAMGIGVSGLKSENIRLFGNGGAMLPEKNSDFRYDDLQENAIAVFDGGDHTFNPGDYFLFYGQGPGQWVYDTVNQKFSHINNFYSDLNFYFINTDGGQGKRISTLSSSSETPNFSLAGFNDYDFHESDDTNLIKSGREYYGEQFDLQTIFDFTFPFPNLKNFENHILDVKVAAKSTSTSSFFASVGDEVLMTLVVGGVSGSSEGEYARTVSQSRTFEATGDEIVVNLEYNKSTNSSLGWLDNIQLNVVREMKFPGGQMGFRSIESVGEGRISDFTLNTSGSSVTIWEITDILNIKKIDAVQTGNDLKFVLPTPVLRDFVAFDNSTFFTPVFVEDVANQNLHGTGTVDYIIVSHPDFLSEAERLKAFHSDFSGLKTIVVTTQQLYNEFSSGKQDLSAIRDYVRMLYERAAEGEKPRYLLLFGDASYDFKNKIANNTNFIPTYESDESLHYISSYVTDDYFGFLDPGEGTSKTDLLDIGIGRFVVATAEEARSAVDKSIHYATSLSSVGDWRNVVTFVADDEDGNSHLSQAEQLAQMVTDGYKTYNVDKIYIDSYTQVSTQGGQRYPEVNEAINSRIEKGSLIMNYTGHGGEVGWAHERILENSDINSWKNMDKLTVLVTATCEFARYDDPGRVSAGELVFLNPNGGGISLFTTARATFGGSNLSLNKGFYEYVFEKVNGEHYAMGDLIKLAKLESEANETNDKKFVLLGDPALKIAYPVYNIETTAVNNIARKSGPDTLNALSTVVISGKITDEERNLVSSYNGTLFSVVYDKESTETTLGQDYPSSQPATFTLRKNIVYKGKTTVKNGVFEFSFIVPIDIAYQYGNGKISYYANDEMTDASGFDDDILVGGFNNSEITDYDGPKIKLYMNDDAFRDGDVTSPDPVLVAHISDKSGINTVGNGIGHDIVAILDGNSDKPFILNDFYETDLDGYQNGTVEYPFFNLVPGEHQVMLKIWDVYNNPSEAYLKFVVYDENQLVISNLMNKPNPFYDYTYFVFNHNKSDQEINIEINIYDLSGRLVKTINDRSLNGGFYSSPYKWKGTSEGGYNLKGGLYIYRVNVQDADGNSNSSVGKLIIAR